MGLFFQKRKRKKSSKLVNLTRIIFVIGVFSLLAIGYRSDFDFFYLGLASILVGIINIVNGAESQYHREDKVVYIPEYLLGVFFLVTAFVYIG